jgi:hypothetical protein
MMLVCLGQTCTYAEKLCRQKHTGQPLHDLLRDLNWLHRRGRVTRARVHAWRARTVLQATHGTLRMKRDRASLRTGYTFIAEKLCSIGRSRSLAIERGVS